MKLGQHFDLTNLCRCGGIKRKRKRNVFKDLSAPPLVLASDMKIYSNLKGIEILSDCSTLKTLNTQSMKSGGSLQQSHQEPVQVKWRSDGGYFCKDTPVPQVSTPNDSPTFSYHMTSEICSILQGCRILGEKKRTL